MYMCVHVRIHIHMYIYTCVHVYTCTYIPPSEQRRRWTACVVQIVVDIILSTHKRDVKEHQRDRQTNALASPRDRK